MVGTGEIRWRLILATFVEVEGKMNWEVFYLYAHLSQSVEIAGSNFPLNAGPRISHSTLNLANTSYRDK